MSTGRRATRRTVYLFSTLIVVAVLVLFFVAPQFLTILEAKLYDLHFAVRGRQSPGDRVAIVAIDEQSLAALGRWPWPRSLLADLVDRLTAADARVVAIDLLLSEPEVSGELRAATRLTERFATLGLLRAGPAGEAVQREVEALARGADHDARLEAAIRASGRVILPVAFEPDPRRPAGPPDPTGPALPSALTAFQHYAERGLYPPQAARGATTPIPRLAAAARALGHVTMLPDPDGSSRWEHLVIEYGGRYYPSLGVQAVRLAQGVEAADFRLDFGRQLEVGPLRVPVDPRNRMLIDYAGPGGTFPHFSAVELLAGRVPADALRNRVVFVGTTAEGTYDLRVTPTSPVLPGVEKHANVAADILGGHPLRRPDWVELVEAFGIVFWPTLLAWLLPRLRPVAGLVAALAAWVVLFAGAHLAFLQGLWIPVVYSSLALFLSPVAITGYLYLTEERQRRDIKRAFQRFVSPEVVEQIAANPAALQFGGEVRTLTVLFSDIRGFTDYTERHPPQEVVHMLRELFTRMVDRILAQGGTLDKFIGDAVMAIFGAPVDLPDHAERACRAAIDMLAELDQLRAKWIAEGREPFQIGIGINTGEMVVGNLGSEQLFDYTVVGDAVNLGARLESLTRSHETRVPIIISETTYEAARDVLQVRRLGEVQVKGRARSVVVYELEGVRPRSASAETRLDAAVAIGQAGNGAGPGRMAAGTPVATGIDGESRR